MSEGVKEKVTTHLRNHGKKYIYSALGAYALWFLVPTFFYASKGCHNGLKEELQRGETQRYCEELIDDALEEFGATHSNGFVDVREVPLFLDAIGVQYDILPLGHHYFRCTSYDTSYVSVSENGFSVYFALGDLERYLHEKN